MNKIKLKYRDCFNYLINNYSDCIDTMDSIDGLKEVIQSLEDKIEIKSKALKECQTELGEQDCKIQSLESRIESMKNCGNCWYENRGRCIKQALLTDVCKKNNFKHWSNSAPKE